MKIIKNIVYGSKNFSLSKRIYLLDSLMKSEHVREKEALKEEIHDEDLAHQLAYSKVRGLPDKISSTLGSDVADSVKEQMNNAITKEGKKLQVNIPISSEGEFFDLRSLDDFNVGDEKFSDLEISQYTEYLEKALTAILVDQNVGKALDKHTDAEASNIILGIATRLDGKYADGLIGLINEGIISPQIALQRAQMIEKIIDWTKEPRTGAEMDEIGTAIPEVLESLATKTDLTQVMIETRLTDTDGLVAKLTSGWKKQSVPLGEYLSRLFNDSLGITKALAAEKASVSPEGNRLMKFATSLEKWDTDAEGIQNITKLIYNGDLFNAKKDLSELLLGGSKGAAGMSFHFFNLYRKFSTQRNNMSYMDPTDEGFGKDNVREFIDNITSNDEALARALLLVEDVEGARVTALQAGFENLEEGYVKSGQAKEELGRLEEQDSRSPEDQVRIRELKNLITTHKLEDGETVEKYEGQAQLYLRIEAEMENYTEKAQVKAKATYEQMLSAYEGKIDADLLRGKKDELIGGLTALILLRESTNSVIKQMKIENKEKGEQAVSVETLLGEEMMTFYQELEGIGTQFLDTDNLSYEQAKMFSDGAVFVLDMVVSSIVLSGLFAGASRAFKGLKGVKLRRTSAERAVVAKTDKVAQAVKTGPKKTIPDDLAQQMRNEYQNLKNETDNAERLLARNPKGKHADILRERISLSREKMAKIESEFSSAGLSVKSGSVADEAVNAASKRAETAGDDAAGVIDDGVTNSDDAGEVVAKKGDEIVASQADEVVGRGKSIERSDDIPVFTKGQKVEYNGNSYRITGISEDGIVGYQLQDIKTGQKFAVSKPESIAKINLVDDVDDVARTALVRTDKADDAVATTDDMVKAEAGKKAVATVDDARPQLRVIEGRKGKTPPKAPVVAKRSWKIPRTAAAIGAAAGVAGATAAAAAEMTPGVDESLAPATEKMVEAAVTIPNLRAAFEGFDLKTNIIKKMNQNSDKLRDILESEQEGNRSIFDKFFAEHISVSKEEPGGKTSVDRVTRGRQWIVELQDFLQTKKCENGEPYYTGNKDGLTRELTVDAVQDYLDDQDHVDVTGSVETQNFYTIKRGDYLGKIAKQHKTTVKDLMKANPEIDDPRKIHPGQRLKIPTSETPE